MKKKQKILCVIPARSSSKRIKNKNIKSFLGKPIIAWSIEAAINSKCFDKVIVSTNSKKISKIANSYMAETPFLRSKKLSSDKTPMFSVIQDSIKQMIKRNYKPDIVCCLFATAPLLNFNNIKKGLKLLLDKNKKFVLPVQPYSYPIQRALKINKKKHISMANQKTRNLRSQDLPNIYHDAGQFYIGKAESFLREDEIFSKNTFPIFLNKFDTIDIDDLDDWKLAEILFRFKKNK